MIKNILTIITLCVVIGTVPAQSHNKQVEIKDMKIERNQNNLDISFRATVPTKSLKKNYALTVVPVVYYGTKQSKLRPIIVDSRRARIVRERNGVESLPNDALFAVQGQTVNYTVALPYEKWMDQAALRVDKTLNGCGTERFQRPEILCSEIFAPEQRPDSRVFIKPIVPHLEQVYVAAATDKTKMIIPQVSEVERRWEFSKSDMVVDYEVANVGVDPSLFENRQTLNELVKVVNDLYSSGDTTISKIEITGFSSPEGASALNSRLAFERAVSLKDYLQKAVKGLPNSVFKLENGGENWSGLRNAVDQSHMKERSEVLYIIDNIPAAINYKTNTSRKKALMDLNYGRTWNYMLKNFFEQLRNACYIVVYYDKLADTAADTINTAIRLIHNKEYDKALSILSNVKGDPRAWNPIGVCYMMTNRFDQAKQFLQKAAQNGNQQAKENLKEIDDLF